MASGPRYWRTRERENRKIVQIRDRVLIHAGERNVRGAALRVSKISENVPSVPEFPFANAEGADFRQADLRGTCLYRTETCLCRRFDGAVILEQSDVPGRRIVGGTVRVIG
jgi:uncharacterized protein YjbI with pentapeptide repeats